MTMRRVRVAVACLGKDEDLGEIVAAIQRVASA
jgi:hypothetical protein